MSAETQKTVISESMFNLSFVANQIPYNGYVKLEHGGFLFVLSQTIPIPVRTWGYGDLSEFEQRNQVVYTTAFILNEPENVHWICQKSSKQSQEENQNSGTANDDNTWLDTTLNFVTIISSALSFHSNYLETLSKSIEHANTFDKLMPWGVTESLESIWVDPKYVKHAQWAKHAGFVGDFISLGGAAYNIGKKGWSIETGLDLGFAFVGFRAIYGDIAVLIYMWGKSTVKDVKKNPERAIQWHDAMPPGI